MPLSKAALELLSEDTKSSSAAGALPAIRNFQNVAIPDAAAEMDAVEKQQKKREKCSSPDKKQECFAHRKKARFAMLLLLLVIPAIATIWLVLLDVGGGNDDDDESGSIMAPTNSEQIASNMPSIAKSISSVHPPSLQPTTTTSMSPTNERIPSAYPTSLPSKIPSISPSNRPTINPTVSLHPSSTPSTSTPPTQSHLPSSQPTNEKYSSLLKTLQSVSDLPLLLDETTPQGRTLHWLSYEDAFELALGDEEVVRQRYACSLLFFVFHGDDWTVKTDWLGPTNVCKWYGILCNKQLVTEISLSFNGLKGEIPIEIEELLFLENLELSQNQISGTIPTSMGKLLQLRRFEVGDNELEGVIPGEMYDLEKLTHVHLMGNKLQDNISSQIGRLTLLQQLELHSNLLSGELPTEFGMLGNLQVLTLHYNQFVNANIPAELCLLKNSNPGTFTELTSDCLKFPGHVQCDCCSTCYCNNPDPNACSIVGPPVVNASRQEIFDVMKKRPWINEYQTRG
mmetsp:Transcript_11413/g.17160  ORF Transcript_11413/g.17160 Transcript_11413/m.17160 type:complete len:511 (-) Transcript_11413:187-1719(-)|eukprot:CAMPEP_0196822308 /NCGR_PEP_ID=MMETSP1362-20130617/82927_1 /TAXON_ID=163516 /ORGANISM="Leptocylindrus danicus, Strain CCMP1856" /LENGTH=510 /DNA_ID=CAMNT_0042201827 /DNA_START=25 /DNA_END=1557 /DNA_ORIENTATION=+